MFKKIYYVAVSLIIAPMLLFMIVSLVNFNTDNVAYFMRYSLSNYLLNTIVIIIIASIVAVVISFYLAYMMTFYQFKYKKIVEVILVLPLSIPVYIGAYTYADIFSPTAWFYQTTGLNIDIMNIWGLIGIYVIFLYPYIYLPLRGFLYSFNASIYETAVMFTSSKYHLIKNLIFPLCIPTLSIGITFFLFEIFSDYGAAKYFGVETFAQAINQAWFTYNNMTLSLIISLIFGGLIWILILIKQQITMNKKFNVTRGKRITKLNILGKKQKLHFVIISFILIGIGFVIPVTYMVISTIKTIPIIKHPEFFSSFYNTISSTVIVTLIIFTISLVISNYAARFKNYQKYLSIFLLGYMLPSIMISLFIYQSFLVIQNFTGFVVTQSFVMVIYAYVVRFISVSNANITNGFTKISNVHLDNARMFGFTEFQTFKKIKIPLIRSTLIYTLMLVILEVSKELSLMLFLRPFGYETLATKAFTYANDELVMQSSMYSLAIVSLCVFAIISINVIKEKNASV